MLQGTLAAPSINFQGDLGTGIFSPGPGQIALAQNGNLFAHGSSLDLSAALGQNALALSTGLQNVAVGFNALAANTNGLGNVAVGFNALSANTIGGGSVAVGADALANHTTGSENVAVGHRALTSLTTGQVNTALGAGALSSNLSADGNTAVGFNSQATHQTGNQNTAVGSEALKENATGVDNTAVGATALVFGGGSRNTAVGRQALGTLFTGSNDDNIALGYQAGNALTVGSNNVFIGSSGIAGDNDTIRLGGTHTHTFVAGIRGVTTGVADGIPVLVDSAGQLGTVSSSRRFKFDIADMGDASSGLMRLRPVTFRYKQPTADGSHPLQYGLIAEEVAEVNRDLVVYEPDGQALTVKYNLLPALLLNEVQRQQRTIDELTRRLEELERRLTTQQR